MGYIKLFRKIQDWGWYDDPNTLTLWVHLLVDANWKDNAEWHGEPVGRGELITSVAKISADTGLTDRQVRTALSHLVSTGEIVMKATNKWTKITVCKYDTYQSASPDECQADDEQATSNRQAGDKQPTTLEESKKEITEEEKKVDEAASPSAPEKPKRKVFVKPTIEQVAAYCKEKGYDVEAERFFNYYESKGWVVGKSPMKDWKAAVRTWASNQKSSQPTSSPQVAPDPSSKNADMYKAQHPTQEEINKKYRDFFLPFYPPNDGESKEAYNERIRPFWDSFFRNWINDRVQAVNNKY